MDCGCGDFFVQTQPLTLTSHSQINTLICVAGSPKSKYVRCEEGKVDSEGAHHNLDQDLLLRAVKKHVSERWIVLDIERWLKAPSQERMGGWFRGKKAHRKAEQLSEIEIFKYNGARRPTPAALAPRERG